MEHVGMRKGSKAKVRGSWGVYDALKYIRKHGWMDIGKPITEKEFYAIVRSINKLLAEEIANGQTVKFPLQMGKLELRKFQRGVSFVDGKLKNTYPIDWHNTLLLWEQDEEAKKNRIRLRHENEWVYHVKYDSWMAMYENKKFYRFALNTFIKWELSKNIKQGKVDTLW
jgi:hypothetical protein